MKQVPFRSAVMVAALAGLLFAQADDPSVEPRRIQDDLRSNQELIEKIKQMKGQVREQEAELEQNKEMRTKISEAREFRKQASELCHDL